MVQTHINYISHYIFHFKYTYLRSHHIYIKLWTANLNSIEEFFIIIPELWIDIVQRSICKGSELYCRRLQPSKPKASFHFRQQSPSMTISFCPRVFLAVIIPISIMTPMLLCESLKIQFLVYRPSVFQFYAHDNSKSNDNLLSPFFFSKNEIVFYVYRSYAAFTSDFFS